MFDAGRIVQMGAHRDLAAEGEIAVLLIEQNLGVAIEVADRIGVMVNGRIAHEMSAPELAADRELQERLLGVRAGDDDTAAEAAPTQPAEAAEVTVLRVQRAYGGDGTPSMDDGPAPRTVRGYNRWNAGGTSAPRADIADLPGVRVVPSTLQAAPPEILDGLQSGDALFIDSSHILMPGSDVDILLNRVLPKGSMLPVPLLCVARFGAPFVPAAGRTTTDTCAPRFIPVVGEAAGEGEK